jgi:DNA-binding beta-propeller fold protein YncE
MKYPSLLALIGVLLLVTPASAQAQTPYTTWTLGPGWYFVRAQDAYTPLDQIDLPVDAPEDMFYAPDGYLYVADTGNGRILKLDESFAITAEFGGGLLESPTGVFVDDDGAIYVADAGRDMIVILDAAGELVREFGRPTEPLFGEDRQFLPRKIASDPRGNLYIVSEGSVNGLVMMNREGSFIGYFAANLAQMSLQMLLQRLFLSDEQLDQFIRNEAASPTNLAIDSQALVYTVTSGTDPSRSIRKFTVSGSNLMDSIYGSNNFRDIHVSDDGLMTTIDGDGQIHEYDLNGTLLFVFGAVDQGDQLLGLLAYPTAIERVGGNLVVLDRDKNAIVTFRVTDFARTLHDGVRLYMDGFYEEARPYFETVMDYNGLVVMAYYGLANADYSERDYANALQYFRFAGSRSGYSEAFWELRNVVLQRYLGTALIGIVVIWSALGVFNRLEARRGWLDPLRRGLHGLRRFRLVDDFAFLFRFIRKPVDSFYYIKQNERGSLLFALLLFAWIVLVRVLSSYVTGFIFSPFVAPWEIDIEMEVVYTVLPLALWIAGNYLVATISDGEGSLRHVVIGTAYSLFPYALFMLPIVLISNLLTFNEAFLYTFTSQLVIVWCGIMFVIMVTEIHNFTLGETIRNIAATLFTMAILLLTSYILYVLFDQLFQFVEAVVQESLLRG